MKKSLVIPVPTPAGIPSEGDLRTVGIHGELDLHGPQGTRWKETLIYGAPQHFHDACQSLLASFIGKADAILVGGTTGEGVGLGLLQHRALLSTMKKYCPTNIRILMGLLGADQILPAQIRLSQQSGIHEFVLGLNHTGDNQTRFNQAINALEHGDKLWLYNMPAHTPAERGFILQCMDDMRVVGIKDSSGDLDTMNWLLSLKGKRPDFQVLHGSETGYAELPEDKFAQIDGLVAGNANTNPHLLREFAQRPKDFAGSRRDIADRTANLPLFRGDSPSERIEQHILGIKMQLWKLGFFESKHVAMLKPKRGTLFQTNSD